MIGVKKHKHVNGYMTFCDTCILKQLTTEKIV